HDASPLLIALLASLFMIVFSPADSWRRCTASGRDYPCTTAGQTSLRTSDEAPAKSRYAVIASGTRWVKSVRASYACPTRKTVGSSKGRPKICMPIGSPVVESPHGTDIAGRPVTFPGAEART